MSEQNVKDLIELGWGVVYAAIGLVIYTYLMWSWTNIRLAKEQTKQKELEWTEDDEKSEN